LPSLLTLQAPSASAAVMAIRMRMGISSFAF
jgi:hypothetical protein